MEESVHRREDYIKTLTSSFHHSQDKRWHIKQRQSKELENSVLLLTENQKRIKAANMRRTQYIYDIKTVIRQRN